MGSRKTLRWLTLLPLLLVVAGDAIPQVPPHYPGTICYTRQFWCWANPPGPPGALCYCPSPYGPVPGTLG